MKNFSRLLLFLLVMVGCKSSPSPQEHSLTPDVPGKTIDVDPATAGSVSGFVSFQGVPPQTPSIDMTQDPGCPSRPQPSEAVRVNNGRLANVFVYVKEGLPQGRFAIPAEPAVLDQKGCRYLPHVLGVMAGQQLRILNTDTADHNVHDFPRNNPEWNESQKPTDPAIVKIFPYPELMIPIRCNQHPWMKAYLSVMSHPYFAVSAADGSFRIGNLPPGQYAVTAVHEKLGEQTMKVTVGAKETAKADFSFSAP